MLLLETSISDVNEAIQYMCASFYRSSKDFLLIYVCYLHEEGGRDSSVGIATRYGLDGPGIESWWGRDFPHPSRPSLGAHPASCTMGAGSFPGVKRPGLGADPPTPIFSAEVLNWVQLYLYPP